jgi:hypothetical protein
MEKGKFAKLRELWEESPKIEISFHAVRIVWYTV